MKVIILQENLNQGLTICSRFVAPRPQLPILANILLKTEKGRLKLSATDLEMGVNIWVGGKIEKEGEITISAKTVNEFVASLPPEKVNLELKENNLIVSSTFSKSVFPTIAAADFPKIPGFPKKTALSMSLSLFSQSVAQVAFAAATDEGRPVLTGVLLKPKDKGFSLVATDGYRLSVKKVGSGKWEAGSGIIIPAKALIEASRVKGGEGEKEGKEKKDGTLQIGLTEKQNQVVFALPDLELSSRLIEGEFPDFEKIIPTETKTTIIFDREEFLRAVRIASIFARESANIVKLKIEKGKLKISANAPQVGENESIIDVKIKGEEQEIAFNFRFLLDFLNSISSEQVTLEMTGALNPGVFKPLSDDSFLHIIMPVRVQS